MSQLIRGNRHRGRRRWTAAGLAVTAAVCAACGGGHAADSGVTSTAVPTRSSKPVPIVPPPKRVLHVGGGRLGTQTSLGGVPVPFNPTYFHLTDFWVAQRHRIYIEVYAGAPAMEPRRGALIVNWTDPKVGLPESRSGMYRAPAPAGPLTLFNVRGNVVYFRYVGGRGTFDLGTRRFQIVR